MEAERLLFTCNKGLEQKMERNERIWYNKTIQKRSIYGHFRNSSEN